MFSMIYTAIIIMLMTLALIKELQRPSIIIFTALLLLYFGGILNIKETFNGFSNQGMLTVAALFIVAGALQSSNHFGDLIYKAMGSRYGKFTYIRLMAPVIFLSSFLNNTPIVMTLIPFVKNWAKKNNLAPSKFLIPLSYASILGGTCTLIGTSTNLVVHGLMLENGLEGFSFFEIGKIGLPLAIVGVLYFSTIGRRLLPNRKDALIIFQENSRNFVAQVTVTTDFPYLNKTISQAGLRHLRGLYLFQIERHDQILEAISPDEVLQEGDNLYFTGLPQTIFDLLKTKGLKLIEDTNFNLNTIDSDKLKTYEAVVSNNSPLIGQTVQKSSFRTKYKAVILAIHRNGHRIDKKIGDISFQANDTLLILATRNFAEKWYHSSDFALVSNSIDHYSKPAWKGILALCLAGLMILSVSLGFVTSMLIAATVTAGLMIFTNIISYNDAKKAMDFDILLVIASSFGIGKAIANSGLAEFISSHLITSLNGMGILGILGGLYFLTTLYTEIITNNAAAALLFPIALSTAQSLGVSAHPFMLIVALGASASFSTPIGYQTNMMVYSPGSYKFSDFLKTGIVMNIIAMIVTTSLVYFFYF
ncbi:MAG: SLC13 family permease [Candidatus Marinimicrobia bacterium]|nr:SLC13 family permease [Candidatus Neomarinimicrobiota bacterium]